MYQIWIKINKKYYFFYRNSAINYDKGANKAISHNSDKN